MVATFLASTAILSPVCPAGDCHWTLSKLDRAAMPKRAAVRGQHGFTGITVRVARVPLRDRAPDAGEAPKGGCGGAACARHLMRGDRLKGCAYGLFQVRHVDPRKRRGTPTWLQSYVGPGTKGDRFGEANEATSARFEGAFARRGQTRTFGVARA